MNAILSASLLLFYR